MEVFPALALVARLVTDPVEKMGEGGNIVEPRLVTTEKSLELRRDQVFLRRMVFGFGNLYDVV